MSPSVKEELLEAKEPTRMIAREEQGIKTDGEHIHVQYRCRVLHRWKALKLQYDALLNEKMNERKKKAFRGKKKAAAEDAKQVSTDWRPTPLGIGAGYIIRPHHNKPTCTMGRLVRW